jgi:transcriptional regulator with XRE-family HTH domain
MRQNVADITSRNAFRMLRTQLQLSQVRTAAALGMKQARISKIERSKKQPNFEYIQRLVKWALDNGLDVDIDSLFDV